MDSVTVEVDTALLEEAERAGRPHGRRASEQLRHWVRLGRHLGSGSSVDLAAVARALDSGADPEALGEAERAVVRAELEIRGLERSERAD